MRPFTLFATTALLLALSSQTRGSDDPQRRQRGLHGDSRLSAGVRLGVHGGVSDHYSGQQSNAHTWHPRVVGGQVAVRLADRVAIGIGYDALVSQFQTTYVLDTFAWGKEKLSAGLLYATAGYQAPVWGNGLPYIGGAVDLGLLWASRDTYHGDTMAVRYSVVSSIVALRLKGIVRQVIWRGLEAQIEGGWSSADFKKERIDYFENFGGDDADAWYSLDFDGPFVTMMFAISRSPALRDSRNGVFTE